MDRLFEYIIKGSYQLAQGVLGEKRKLLVASCYGVREFPKICEERDKLAMLSGKTLQIKERHYLVQILYYNIPKKRSLFPLETLARINDLNDEALLFLSFEAFQKLKLPTEELSHLLYLLQRERRDFFQKSKVKVGVVDEFRLLQKKLIKELKELPSHELSSYLLALLQKKDLQGKKLQHSQELTLLTKLSHLLGFEFFSFTQKDHA